MELAFEEAVELARASAKAEGFAAGYANGRTRAADQVRLELEVELASLRAAELARMDTTTALLTSLGRLVDELESRMVPTYEQVADRLGPAAYSIVEAILGRELNLSKELALDAVRRVCKSAPRGSDFTVWLNPAAIDALDGLDLTSIAGRPMRLLADTSLNNGDALAESGATRVDARLATSLGRVREMLEA
ncbi:flagellar assembly protein H [mine drainage metagenome]|uniref:Flagellar assembly protein H n=1 Tax=mine drainage metagenome TaxID=410659 RepID=A0A1J5PMN3_9ZZZZ